MNNLDLIIIIGLVILFLQYNNQQSLAQKQIIQVEQVVNEPEIIYKPTVIPKTGTITRHTILDESGGSKHYDNVKIESNISGNIIPIQDKYKTYAKMPSKILM